MITDIQWQKPRKRTFKLSQCFPYLPQTHTNPRQSRCCESAIKHNTKLRLLPTPDNSLPFPAAATAAPPLSWSSSPTLHHKSSSAGGFHELEVPVSGRYAVHRRKTLSAGFPGIVFKLLLPPRKIQKPTSGRSEQHLCGGSCRSPHSNSSLFSPFVFYSELCYFHL